MAATSVNLNQRGTFNARGYVMTPDGVQPGIQRGLMRGDETIVDTETGLSSIPSGANPSVVGTTKDRIPVGEPGAFGNGGVFDRSSILGGRVDMTDPNGRTFQQLAWAPAKLRELVKYDSAIKNKLLLQLQQQYDVERDANDNHKHRNSATKSFVSKQLERRFNNIKDFLGSNLARNLQVDAELGLYLLNLADKQEMQYGSTADENGLIMANKGKNPKYAWGKGLVGPALGLAATLPYLIRESNWVSRNQPARQYEFVDNPNAAAAVDTLSKLRYDNSADMIDALRAERRGLYGIKLAGNLSTGQRRALANDLINGSFARRAAIRQQAQQINNKYIADAAQTALKAGESYASRLLQAKHNQNEAYARALGAQQQLWATNNKNWYTGIMSNIRDWDTALYRNRLLNMYDADIASKSNKYVPKENSTVLIAIPPYLDRNPRNWPAPEISTTTKPFVWDWNNLIPPTIADYSNFKWTDLING